LYTICCIKIHQVGFYFLLYSFVGTVTISIYEIKDKIISYPSSYESDNTEEYANDAGSREKLTFSS
jgi:hypothetical protein